VICAEDTTFGQQEGSSHAQKDVEMKRARLRRRMRLVSKTNWRIVVNECCYSILRRNFLKPPSFLFAYAIDVCPCMFNFGSSGELRSSVGVLDWKPPTSSPIPTALYLQIL
jgi:hypothetical protein